MLLHGIVFNKLLFPEILTASLICIILLIDLLITKKHKVITYCLTQAGLVAIMLLLAWNFRNLFDLQNSREENIFLIANGFAVNSQINFLKIIIIGCGVMIIGYSKDYLQQHKHCYGEYLVLNMLAMLGAMITISSRHLFNLYFGVEMLSLPIYGLIALGNKQYHLEAALKYFILSAIFSGILLYGLSLLYGATGSLDFKSIINFIALGNINNLFKVGMILLFIGLFFKLNLVPFHLWVPDVYQGAVPTIGMLIATIPKITTIAILGYLLQEVFNKYVNYNWQNLLIAISLSSIIIGNLGAILQNNLKRLLGYAAVAHSGFMLLGLATNQKSGMFAANLYVIVYSFMVIGIFGTVAIFANNIKDGQFVKIDDFAGLANQHPWFAGILLIILLSMAGVPPTVGFYVKFLIIKELIAAKLTWVAIVSLLLSLMAWFYYLKIIKSMYFIQPDLGAINKQHNISISNFSMGIITMNAILILATSILPIVTNYNYIHFLY